MTDKPKHFPLEPSWRVSDSISPITPAGYTAPVTGSPSWLSGADSYRYPHELLVRFLSGLAGCMLDFHQEQALMAVLEALPKDSNISDLVEALAGNDQLTTLRVGLQDAAGKGAYLDIFSNAQK